MSLIALGLNGLLAVLLLAALAVGLRLNGRLKALRESQDGFEAAVQELNHAAHRAEQGLADLRAATDEASDVLSDRIEKGRALANRLEGLTAAAPERPRAAERSFESRGLPPVSPPAREDVTSQRLAALLALARGRLDAAAEAQRPAFAPLDPPEAVAPQSRPAPRRFAVTPDDDLFEDALELDRPMSARR
ncbi:MAG: DUF6468 domain-containing protein [Phenylobacterium sp.]|jgi:hypothetical protein